MSGKVDWYGDELMVLLEGVTDDALMALAFEIEGQTKQNINEEDLIDTGFMVNSVYAVGQDGAGSYDAAKAAALAAGASVGVKSGQVNSAEMGDKAPFENDKQRALVAVGAEYFIFHEQKKSLLHAAAKEKAAEFGGIVEQKGKEAGL